MSEPRLFDYAASANCYKVRLLLAQLAQPYERIPVDIFAGGTLTDDYAAKNPMRATPVLEYEPGAFLPESNAILVYLATGSDFLPVERSELAQVCRWLIYEQTDVIPTMGGLRFRLITGRLVPEDEEARRRRRGALEVLRLLDDHLQDHDFFVGGRYTIADIGLYGYVHVAHEAGLAMEDYAAVQAWIARVAGRPGFIDDLEPYPANARPGVAQSIYD